MSKLILILQNMIFSASNHTTSLKWTCSSKNFKVIITRPTKAIGFSDILGIHTHRQRNLRYGKGWSSTWTKMLENSQNMKVQFSVNLIIWFKVLRKLVKLSLTVKTGQTMSSTTG